MLRLSEAIRLGAMLGPQCFGAYVDYDGVTLTYCAMGGALKAIGIACADLIKNPVTIPAAWMQRADCDSPCSCHTRLTSLSAIVVHLNDEHSWTREAIAGWVETVEEVHAGAWPDTVTVQLHTDA